MTRPIRILLSFLAIGGVVALAAILLRPTRGDEGKKGSGENGETRRQEDKKTANQVSGNSGQNSEPNAQNGVSPSSPSPSSLLLVGSVQAGAQANLSTRLPARIVGVYAKEGASVRVGQLLVALDTSDVEAQLKTARAGVETARAQARKAEAGKAAQRVKADSDVATAQAGLRQAETKRDQARLAWQAAQNQTQVDITTAREGVRKAQAGRDRARQTLKDLQGLAEVGGVSRSDLEGAQTQLTVAEADLATAQAGLKSAQASLGGTGEGTRAALAKKDYEAAQAGVAQAQTGVTTAIRARRELLAVAEEDIRTAQAGIAQAEAGVSAAGSQLASTRLVAPITGTVSQVNARVGEIAQPGLPLVMLLGESGLKVEALATARQLARLRVGQAATIEVDTRPGVRFPGVVSALASAAEPDGRTFRVTFHFTANPPALRPGQTARITVASSVAPTR